MLGAASSFKLALPGYTYAFPRDHGSHPAYATEWWYYTGHLKSTDGRRFGYQATWFRIALAPKVSRTSHFATRDLFFGHLALTDETGRKFYFTDRIERAALGLAGATHLGDGAPAKTPVAVWVGDWRLQFGGAGGRQQRLRAAGNSDAPGTEGTAFGLDLRQVSQRAPVINGQDGVSQKSAGLGRASHYYSYTRLGTQGTLQIDGEQLNVTGESWFDHEFGSNQMSAGQVGWDWFSLQLEDGRDLMVYRLRLKGGKTEPLSSGTLVYRDGRSRHLPLRTYQLVPGKTWLSPRTGGNYPVQWQVLVPGEGLILKVEAVFPEQELVPRRSGAGTLAYWEGSVRVTGSSKGKPIRGQGYLEMTGYSGALTNVF